MCNIDLIRRIANTIEGRTEIGLPNEKIQVSEEDKAYVFIHSSGFISIPKSNMETTVVRNILSSLLPDGYKVEMTFSKENDNNYSNRCSVHSIRNHHTLTFAYGKSSLEASSKCVLGILNLIKNGEDKYESIN
jgi:hypothetical protein